MAAMMTLVRTMKGEVSVQLERRRKTSAPPGPRRGPERYWNLLESVEVGGHYDSEFELDDDDEGRVSDPEWWLGLADLTDSEDEEEVLAEPPNQSTTWLLGNIPRQYTRDSLLQLLDEEGFGHVIDFLYMPFMTRTGAHVGYAYVNCVSMFESKRFYTNFRHFTNWTLRGRPLPGPNPPSHLTDRGVTQGLEANIEHYRNSAVMGPNVPDAYKPVVLRRRRRVPFPAPTRPILPPARREKP